jgi:hypothetical protein
VERPNMRRSVASELPAKITLMFCGLINDHAAGE